MSRQCREPGPSIVEGLAPMGVRVACGDLGHVLAAWADLNPEPQALEEFAEPAVSTLSSAGLGVAVWRDPAVGGPLTPPSGAGRDPHRRGDLPGGWVPWGTLGCWGGVEPRAGEGCTGGWGRADWRERRVASGCPPPQLRDLPRALGPPGQPPLLRPPPPLPPANCPRPPHPSVLRTLTSGSLH